MTTATSPRRGSGGAAQRRHRRARSIAQLSCASDECCAADYLWDWLTPEKRGSYLYSGTDTAPITSTKPTERSLKSVHRECWKCL
jgi:hypothetical protein